ncbi:MAG: hypothetical protein GY886_01000 [Gammaproteobacteria bacterium]|nr:hypothetical protein [Gammaproteobacteria bacterium]MCP4830771.1 hypothetical protein [Gammaproteobacteria bacterium]MCP4929560.1 hypothetical protein [Gammaproteobacteria bacterium]
MKIRFLGVIVLVAVSLATGCSQFTTSKAELAGLDSAAQSKADAYIDCLKREAAGMSGTTDATFLRDAAGQRCEPELDAYKDAQAEYLGAQYMIIDKALTESIVDLEKRGRNEIAEILVTQPASTSASTPVIALVATAAIPIDWNADQRVYLDCMQAQGEKYAALNENVERIAEVAASRCRDYLGTEARQALEQEGRAQVMGAVFDARLDAAAGQ